MSGYYPPGNNVPFQYYNINPNALPDSNARNGAPLPRMIPDPSYASGLPENPFHPAITGPFVQYTEPPMHSKYGEMYEDISGPLGSAQGSNARARRRALPGEQVKHRRTRSGCFTCRQRRVKCDEAHPTCDRCRKGGRECIYPDKESSQKPIRSGSRSEKSSAEGTSSPEDHEEDGNEHLPIIYDDDEAEDDDMEAGFIGKSQDWRDSPASTFDQSTSPSTEASSTVPPTIQQSLSRRSSAQIMKPAAQPRTSSQMPKDVQFYLNYFKDHMTHHHYSLKHDSHNFLKGEFLSHALKYEPLKYAVGGFAAYFHTISQPDGRMSTFLQFYNESVSRLRMSITKNKKQGLATFLTILQLASIEEMLGDWVNLMGHQKAAFEMLTRLYTPKTIVQSDFLLKVLLWYTRFDLFVGLQSGGEAVLSRDWYDAVHECYITKIRDNPDNMGYKYEERFAYSRIVAKESSDLFSRMGKGLLSPEEFMKQLPVVKSKVEGLTKTVSSECLDPTYKVENLHGQPGPEDIVNAFEPNVIWGDDLWTSNFLFLDFWSINFMYDISTSMAFKKPFEPELTALAFKSVQVFEAMCAYPKAPYGAIIEAQVSFAIATLFLPKDPKTVQWCRRTFAKVESLGYIYPDVMRNRMLEVWGLEPSDWWLPNDEGCPPIIRSIKNFIRERSTAPRDQVSEDLKEMRGIFSGLNISDSPGSDSMTVTSNDSATKGAPNQFNGSPEW
ncbi:sequence-specific DNA binding RNA polymerase II transcription factor [Ascochyta rabiei]|uniref:Sequence-specific DNA binding RNA polymerase II transcription factor n=1 Tax=Didymella rabiei TaxID=5454 RepID=A0A162ZE04_DIDRA|nr:sequence-specific DNA binding RNA polymerase II transcription factor [Ascochyta rabiei]